MISALKKYRKKRSLSQQDLAALIGVTQGCIGHIENGRRLPSPQLAVHIEAATNGAVKRSHLRPDLFGKAA